MREAAVGVHVQRQALAGVEQLHQHAGVGAVRAEPPARIGGDRLGQHAAVGQGGQPGGGETEPAGHRAHPVLGAVGQRRHGCGTRRSGRRRGRTSRAGWRPVFRRSSVLLPSVARARRGSRRRRCRRARPWWGSSTSSAKPGTQRTVSPIRSCSAAAKATDSAPPRLPAQAVDVLVGEVVAVAVAGGGHHGAGVEGAGVRAGALAECRRPVLGVQHQRRHRDERVHRRRARPRPPAPRAGRPGARGRTAARPRSARTRRSASSSASRTRRLKAGSWYAASSK